MLRSNPRWAGLLSLIDGSASLSLRLMGLLYLEGSACRRFGIIWSHSIYTLHALKYLSKVLLSVIVFSVFFLLNLKQIVAEQTDASV